MVLGLGFLLGPQKLQFWKVCIGSTHVEEDPGFLNEVGNLLKKGSDRLYKGSY